MVMSWHKIILKESSLEEVRLPARFLGVTLNKPPDSSAASLWLQEKGVPKGESWYFLESENPAFQQIVKEFKAEKCSPPDAALLSPVAQKSDHRH